MSAAPNSFRFFIRDATGETFLWQCGANRPELIASTEAHARWWLAYVRRASARGTYRDRLGNHLPTPVGKVECVMEFYHDDTAD